MTLHQARENLRAAQALITKAILDLGEAFKAEMADTLPEPGDDTMASLGRFAKPAPVVSLEDQLARARLELEVAQRRIRELEAANRCYAERYGELPRGEAV